MIRGRVCVNLKKKKKFSEEEDRWNPEHRGQGQAIMKEVGAPLPLKYGGLAWDGEGTREFKGV